MNKEEEWMLKEKYNGEKTSGFFTDCERLAQGEPLAYVIGFAPFLNTKIWLDTKPLIPRPETEYWVGKAIETLPKYTPLKILDLCAGSGAIGVALAKALPLSHVDFIEIDMRHRSTIIRNICDNGIDYSSTRILGGNLFENSNETYDIILTNPPYIDPELNRTDPNVKLHEPHLALFGGNNGVEIIERILCDAPGFLIPKGTLWIEHEPEQVLRINELAETLAYSSCKNYPDQFGLQRFSVLTRE